jgi:hypothetical protein
VRRLVVKEGEGREGGNGLCSGRNPSGGEVTMKLKEKNKKKREK